MCGFIQLFKKDIGEYDICACREGAKEIIHRGPNDTKEVIHENALFIFNRLSIIDIENGVQPFTFSSELKGLKNIYIKLKKLINMRY